MSLTGNKGEWSEIYTLLKLAAEKKLFSADDTLTKVKTIYKPILSIIREEIKTGTKIEYILNGNIKIIDSNSGNVYIEIPTNNFLTMANQLYLELSAKQTNAFSLPWIDSFLEDIRVQTIKSKSVDKADIVLVVHDCSTGNTPKLSFSIKSLIGKKPTLLNPTPGTNFIYKISHPSSKVLDVLKFNSATYLKGKITLRLKELIQDGYDVIFEKIESENFELNLRLVDGDLPKIVAEMLLLKYIHKKSSSKDLLKLVTANNPLKYNLSKGHPFYQYKLTALLYDYALGMTPEVVWKGEYNANGGIIVVKGDGDVVCYHVYEKNLFQDYLINKTRFEQASTGEDENTPGTKRLTTSTKRYYYGWVYEENGAYYIKLNLQIRFK